MERFVKRTRIPAPAATVFAWHEEPGAFERLTPPGEPVRVLRHPGHLRDGAEVSLRVGPRPFSLRWDLVHADYRPGESFTDRQTRGPFARWVHVHRMIPDGPLACVLEDEIEYALPFGGPLARLARPLVARKLERLFEFRHRVTREAFSR